MENIPQPSSEIRISGDTQALRRKLDEYKERLDEFTAPEMQLDTIYKIAVLEPLLLDGVVDQDRVLESLKEKYGSVDEQTFRNAWRVINDYVETGGKSLVGGTGLPDQEPK